jgi:uridine kinase
MTVKLALPGYEALLGRIHECVGPNRLPLLIAIDGADGVGKSSLASWLAWQLGAAAIHLDLYLVRDSDPLRWRSDDLQRILKTRRVEQASPLVVEGILILDALSKIGRKPDFLVYVEGEGGHFLSSRLADYRAKYQPQQRAQFQLEGFMREDQA